MFKGDSLNFHCTIGGPVDAKEGVVVDFSKGKREIKRALDHHIQTRGDRQVESLLSDNGFDHKLIVPTEPLYRRLSESERGAVSSLDLRADRISDSHCRVTAREIPHFEIELPIDALRSLPADILFDLESGDLKPLQRFLSGYLATSLPGLLINPSLDRRPHTATLEHTLGPDYHLFTYNYTHGLRNSSSYGCQNILHGHLSFVASLSREDASRISNLLDGAFLYDGTNWAEGDESCGYTTHTRGTFSFKGAKRTHHQSIDIGAEPSIENIAAFVAERLRIRSPFFLSEGLQKGCYWEP